MLIEALTVLLFWFCFQFESSRILPGWSLCLSRDENGWQFAYPLQPDPEFQPPLKLFCFSETEPEAKFSRWPETLKRRWPPWLDGDRFVMPIFWKHFSFHWRAQIEGTNVERLGSYISLIRCVAIRSVDTQKISKHKSKRIQFLKHFNYIPNF